MSLFGRVKLALGFGREEPREQAKIQRRQREQSAVLAALELKAAYDSAQTTQSTINHWRLADGLSADEANSLHVRRELRQRSRYETLEANSYAKGIVHTLADDLIGRGPGLQVQIGESKTNQRFQRDFWMWSRKTRLPFKLKTMRLAKCTDGETFAELITNRRLDHLVKLDIHVTECDQYSTPNGAIDPYTMVDGVEFDENGYPKYYHRMHFHPGGPSKSQDFDRIPASEVIHLFRQDRPGQHRGIPETTTALPLFQYLRRYTIATVSSAETQAKHTAVLQTRQNSVNPEQGNSYDAGFEAFDQVPIDYDTMTALPYGWEMKPFDQNQPHAGFDDFVRAILREICRCIQMTASIGLGDSSDSSYAGGRLDVQTYQRAITCEREYWETCCLDRILGEWLIEYRLALSDLALRGEADAEQLAVLAAIKDLTIDDLNHVWTWDDREHVDPAKVATATETDLRMGLTNRAAQLAKRNLDVDEEDQKAADSFGVSLQEYRQALFRNTFGIQTQPETAVGTPENSPAAPPKPSATPPVSRKTRVPAGGVA